MTNKRKQQIMSAWRGLLPSGNGTGRSIAVWFLTLSAIFFFVLGTGFVIFENCNFKFRGVEVTVTKYILKCKGYLFMLIGMALAVISQFSNFGIALYELKSGGKKK